MHRAIALLLLFVATTIASPAPAQVLTTLHSFVGGPTDGQGPEGGLLQAADGNFYGTTTFGGAHGDGTVFKVTPAGTVTTLHSFAGYLADDGVPIAGLAQGTDGNFYGITTLYGGTFFTITPEGALTTLYTASGSIASAISGKGALLQASDGNFYGTSGGGAHGDGAVFKITPSGTLTTVYSFCPQPKCADGNGPYAGLVQGTDGNFYGTTKFGGTSSACLTGCGTVFKVTPQGMLIVLHSFGSEVADGIVTDGDTPLGGLVQASDGNFYGTAFGAGAYAGGTVFKITPDGTLTTLHSFKGYPTEGLAPYAGLVQATDGNFYGTTSEGGSSPSNAGTVFRITPDGTLTTLYNFCSQPSCADGDAPYAGLVQATDGNFYGTTYGGGANAHGTVFRLTASQATTTSSIATQSSSTTSTSRPPTTLPNFVPTTTTTTSSTTTTTTIPRKQCRAACGKQSKACRVACTGSNRERRACRKSCAKHIRTSACRKTGTCLVP